MSSQFTGNAPEVETHANWVLFAHPNSDRANEAARALELDISSKERPDVGTPVLRADDSYYNARNAAYAVLKASFYFAKLDGGGKPEVVDFDTKQPGMEDGAVGIVLVIGEDFCAPAMVQVKKWTQIEILSRPKAKFEATSLKALEKPELQDLPPEFRVVNEFRVEPKNGQFGRYAKVSCISRPARPEHAEKIREFLANGSPGLEECEEVLTSKLEELRALGA